MHALMKRHHERDRAADYRAALIAASMFNAQGGIGGRAIQPWDLMPHLKPKPPTIAEQRANAQAWADAGYGAVGELADVVIMPRGWQPEE